jgi:hypothetical protein
LEEFYHIDFGFDGTATCVAKSEKAGVCVALGGSKPKDNERIGSWVGYALPAGFLKKR